MVSQGPQLQLELFWKWTGISSLEGITRNEYASLIGFASLLTGKRMDREKTKKYFRRLVG